MGDHSTTYARTPKKTHNGHDSTLNVVGNPEKGENPWYVLWHDTFLHFYLGLNYSSGYITPDARKIRYQVYYYYFILKRPTPDTHYISGVVF